MDLGVGEPGVAIDGAVHVVVVDSTAGVSVSVSVSSRP
jgi:hypothetical protein